MRAWLVAAIVLAVAAAGCTAEPSGGGPEPSRSPSPTLTEPTLTLEDISISGGAQANRDGLMLCGDRIVAAPPVAGIENNAFAVFDQKSGEGELTHVELPPESNLEENARWLLVMRCVDSPDAAPDGPVLSFAYQEMPLPDVGGVGVRGAYSLDGQLLWMRDDLNVPSDLVDGLLVLGVAPDQPDMVVDAVTGETLRRFASPLSSRVVLTHDRMVVRGSGGGPVLTDIAGDRVAKLHTSGSFFADGDLIFGVNFRDVAAMRARTGRRVWTFPIRLDPLGTPRVDPSSEVVVFVDHEYVAHGVDATTGQQLWQWPTGVENPRVTAASGLVLLDRRDAGYQVLLDARTGGPLPEVEETIIDLKPAGALVLVDGVATIRSPHELRRPPPSPADDPTETED